MMDAWINRSNINMNLDNFKRICKDSLKRYYENVWRTEVVNSSKCFFYKEFKKELKFENYLSDLDVSIQYFLTRFRTCNHRLPVETGRYTNILKCNRKCNFCNLDDIGDEYHYLCLCPRFNEIRLKILKKDVLKKPSVYEFCKLIINTQNKLIKIAKLSKVILHIIQ